MSKGKGKKKVEEVVKVVETTSIAPLPEGVPNIMSDLTKKQAFKKFMYRGMDITALMGLKIDELSKHFRSRQRTGRRVPRIVGARPTVGGQHKQFAIRCQEFDSHSTAPSAALCGCKFW